MSEHTAAQKAVRHYFVDDTREAKYGVYYTQKNPLTLARLGQLSGI